MAANPILIERPILLTGDGRAVVGRPPEKVRELLEG
jgi:arsenate reductase